MKYFGIAAVVISGCAIIGLAVMILIDQVSPVIIARGAFILPFVMLWGIREIRKANKTI